MTSLVAKLDTRFYPGVASNWDDKLFRDAIVALISSDLAVLDVGAGAGIVAHMNFRGQARRVCGIDLDPRVMENPNLDEAKLADAGSIPYPDGTFDLVFADNVMEHLAEPAAVFREIGRVLKPGGRLLFKTPNKNHYMPLIARITPHRFHQFVNRLRGRAEIDTFPTLYRANSPRDVRMLAERCGCDVMRIDLIEGRPEYLRINVLTYICGIAYERLVNSTAMLSRFRVVMISGLRKRAEQA